MFGSMKPCNQWPFRSDQQKIFMAQSFLLCFPQALFLCTKPLSVVHSIYIPRDGMNENWEFVKHKTNAPYSLWPAGGLRGELVA